MQRVPVTILGGSDHHPGPMPEDAADLHSLGTCKGADISVAGKKLVEWLVQDLIASGGFGPVTIAGPQGVYAPLKLEATLLDTDASVGENLKVAIDYHCSEHGESVPMAIVTYDVVLLPGELSELRQLYEVDSPCACWMPFVRRPEDDDKLGPFAWKPTYHFQSGTESAPFDILPGHLAIIQPDMLELPLLFRLLDLTYATRNSPVSRRKWVLIRRILMNLIKYDFGKLLHGELPRFTYSIPANGLRIARGLKNGTLSISDLESILSKMFLSRKCRKDPDVKGVCHPLVDILGLAEDVDTEEEARGVEKMYAPSSFVERLESRKD